MPVGFLIWGRAAFFDPHKSARPTIGKLWAPSVPSEQLRGLNGTQRGRRAARGCTENPATSKFPAGAGRRETADVTCAFHPASQENTNVLLAEICQQIFFSFRSDRIQETLARYDDLIKACAGDPDAWGLAERERIPPPPPKSFTRRADRLPPVDFSVLG